MSLADERIENLAEKRDLDEKNETIATLQSRLLELEASYENLEAENESLREQLLRASEICSDSHALNDDEEDDLDIVGRVAKFLTHVQKDPTGEVSRELLHLQAINHVMCIRHLDYTKEIHAEESSLIIYPKQSELKHRSQYWQAIRIAFDAACLFVHQISVKQRDPQQAALLEANFPLQWLLGAFPTSSQGVVDAARWLPLHLFLAVDVSFVEKSTEEYQYMTNLELLLTVFGEQAFNEEVSPITIAVAKRQPYLPTIDLLITRFPDCLMKEDEDGSLPLFHAAGCNDNTATLEFLLSIYPDAITKCDNFGCGPVHYAAFAGTFDTLRYILDLHPAMAQLAEGNGALALHDAVMNKRGHEMQLSLVNLLLSALPLATQHRDHIGVLPLHNAARCSDIQVVNRLLHAFPEAPFVADNEGLLPLHHYSERTDKAAQQEVQATLLQSNPLAEIRPWPPVIGGDSNKAKSWSVIGKSEEATAEKTNPLGWLFNRSNSLTTGSTTDTTNSAGTGTKKQPRRSSIKHVAAHGVGGGSGVSRRSSVMRTAAHR